MITEIFEQLISEDFSNDIQIGDRVVVRSNEPDPLMIGKLIGYDQIGPSQVPLVKSEKDAKTYMVLGIIKKYSEELLDELEGMDPKEQWNYLCYPHMRKI